MCSNQVERLAAGERRATTQGIFSFVSLDERHRPQEIPRLLLETEEVCPDGLVGFGIEVPKVVRTTKNILCWQIAYMRMIFGTLEPSPNL